MMRSGHVLASAAVLAVLASCSARQSITPTGETPAASRASTDELALRSPASFSSIADHSTRSAALFTEAARVIQSPRCLNCHPVDRMPTQGDDLHPHVPPMNAGIEGHGPPGMTCNTCHQSANVLTYNEPLASIPGHAMWGLAPASMAWQGKTTREICLQIKDPSRNGGRALAAIEEHMAKDSLVGWAWHPGPNRTPAPGTQAQFGLLIAAWIETGAACPRE